MDRVTMTYRSRSTLEVGQQELSGDIRAHNQLDDFDSITSAKGRQESSYEELLHIQNIRCEYAFKFPPLLAVFTDIYHQGFGAWQIHAVYTFRRNAHLRSKLVAYLNPATQKAFSSSHPMKLLFKHICPSIFLPWLVAHKVHTRPVKNLVISLPSSLCHLRGNAEPSSHGFLRKPLLSILHPCKLYLL